MWKANALAMSSKLARIAVVMATFTSLVLSQVADTGTMVGTIKDQSGGVVPDATIRAIREDTHLERETNTNAEGEFLLPDLPVGTYDFEVEKPGFKQWIQKGISLNAGQSLRLDAMLELGSVQQQVQVQSPVAQVNTLSADVGSTIYGSQVKNLALNTRSFTQLMTLQPGVNSNLAQEPGFGSNTSVPFSFNGAPQSSNNWLVDGGRNIDPYNGNNLTLVSLDAISEVRILRSTYSAQYGRNGGALINVITRSGTNQFHGSLFEFFRNDVLNARNFFATTIPETRYNNYGGTLGGPIRHDKLFFFLSTEYRRIEENTGTRTAIVPTPLQIAGDFTEASPIIDPQTGLQFPANRIPTSRLNPNAQLLLTDYYAPPTPGFQQGALNFTSSAPDGTSYNSGLARLDYNLSDQVTIAAHYNMDDTILNSPYGLFASNSMPGVAASIEHDILYTTGASASWTISPTTVNEFSTSYYHGNLAISTTPFASRTRVSGLNIPRIFNTVTDSSAFIPSINMSQGYAGISILWPQNIHHYTYELRDNVSLVRGNHTIQFGGATDKENKTQDQSNANNNGTFSFTGSFTNNALADMLLGDAFEYTENSNHLSGPLNWTDYSLYLQDEYRISSRLTVTPGIRWEFFPPEKDPNGTISYFDPSRFDPSKAASVLPNGRILIGTQNFGNGVVVAGQGDPYGHAITNTVYDTFEPRFGFSYSLAKDGLTVLRGGYGIFHDRWSQYAVQTRNNYPFNQSVAIFNTSLSNPNQGVPGIFPIALVSFNSPWNIPAIQKWSLGVQRQLPQRLLLDVSYVGSKATDLVMSVDINQPKPSIAAASGIVSPNALRPYPGFAAINSFETTGESAYHSLQASVVRPVSAGFFLQASYTYSKTMDDVVTPINSYAPLLSQWALSPFDRTNVFVASYVWDIPLARDSIGWKHRIAAGWQFSGITTFESGNPLTVTIPGDTAGTGDLSQRPNVVGVATRLKEITEWFNTAAFASPALGTFGNAGRSLVRGPGINNWDLALSKQTALAERLALQFRAEFFNAFNHTQFSAVNTQLGSLTFGRITGALDPRIIQLGMRLSF